MDVRHLPAPVKRVVHLGSRSYGRLTAAGRMTPSFLICGGQRCGTTSLYRALAAHPAVLKAVLHKGVHYFDTSYDRGMGWYKAHFPLLRHGRAGRPSGTACRRRRSSPARTTCTTRRRPPGSPATCRGAKLVVLVRDPVERAYSQHHHEVARGFETGARLRRGARRWSRPGCTGRRSGWPTIRATTASPTSTTRTGPAASTPAT